MLIILRVMIFWKFIEAKDSHISIPIYFKIEKKVINIFSSFLKCVLVISILFFHIVKDVASRAACIHTRDAYCIVLYSESKRNSYHVFMQCMAFSPI